MKTGSDLSGCLFGRHLHVNCLLKLQLVLFSDVEPSILPFVRLLLKFLLMHRFVLVGLKIIHARREFFI